MRNCAEISGINFSGIALKKSLELTRTLKNAYERLRTHKKALKRIRKLKNA